MCAFGFWGFWCFFSLFFIFKRTSGSVEVEAEKCKLIDFAEVVGQGWGFLFGGGCFVLGFF